MQGSGTGTVTKHEVVKTVSFGARVAEEERADLASYFVETEQWRRVWAGTVDVVFAPKGGARARSTQCLFRARATCLIAIYY